MDLDALGNIGDFLGGMGVVVTLVYLAAQIRQNTKQLRANAESLRTAALDETQRSINHWREGIIHRRDVADLWKLKSFLRMANQICEYTECAVLESFFSEMLHHIFDNDAYKISLISLKKP